ncbi:MAG: antibiotic biosynthesis monooxygenase [Xanthobacteraceae bacterium]
MRSFFQLALGLTVLAATLGNPARAQDSAVYIVTYVELMPSEIGSGTTLLKQYRDVSRKEPGDVRFDVLHEIARPNRFAILKVWKDKAAHDAHDLASAQIRDRLKAIEDAPDDQRIDNPLYTTPEKSPAQTATLYVVTHVDVIPPGKDACMTALKAMSSDTAKDPGNIAYQVLVQDGRSNHFTVVEAWSSKAALDAHAMAAHTRSFREKLSPLAGALYDERFYRALD